MPDAIRHLLFLNEVEGLLNEFLNGLPELLNVVFHLQLPVVPLHHAEDILDTVHLRLVWRIEYGLELELIILLKDLLSFVAT